MYRVSKILNKNGVIAINTEDNQEYVLLGKGIGFGKKVSQRFEVTEDTATYRLTEQTDRGSAKSLVQEMDPEFLEIADEVIREAEKVFGKVDRRIMIPLADHISFAVSRIRNQEQISNPLTDDIRVLFHNEFQAASVLRDILQKRMQITIDEHEIGYVALHIHSAIEDEKVSVAMQTARAVRECIEMIEKETGKKKHEEEEKEMKGTEPLSPLPYFPQDHDWPEPLKSILSFAKTPAQHDVLLLGAMTVLGASLSHIVRCKYGDKWQYPCLQTFITGHAAAGKSVLVWVRKLIEPIHEEIRRQVAESMKAYRKELRAYEALGKARKDKEPPVAPPNRMFIIPGNNTGTGLLQNLIDSDGTGIICESEADTVSTAIGTEFGNWSDTLRKAFDHDRLSYNRRTDREYKETTACYLSVLLSGTPAQIKPLISSPENGQFSRNIFYYMPRVGEWKDQFGEDELDVEAEFIRMGHEWKASRDELKKKGLFTLKFTQQQKDEFNGHFSALFYRSSLVTGEEMSASVMRMGTILCRMMCITALLRSLEIPSLAVPDPTINPENLKDGIITRHNLSITDEDFRAVLALCEPLYLHATHILSFLDKSTELNSRGIADREMLYAALPQEFTKQMVMEQAEKLNIPVNTARSWIQRLREKGALDMMMVKGKGVYSKKQR